MERGERSNQVLPGLTAKYIAEKLRHCITDYDFTSYLREFPLFD
jgi:hypothetical protein